MQVVHVHAQTVTKPCFFLANRGQNGSRLTFAPFSFTFELLGEHSLNLERKLPHRTVHSTLLQVWDPSTHTHAGEADRSQCFF